MPAFSWHAFTVALRDFLWTNPLLVLAGSLLLLAVLMTVALHKRAEQHDAEQDARLLALLAREQARRQAQDDILARIQRNHRKDVA